MFKLRFSAESVSNKLGGMIRLVRRTRDARTSGTDACKVTR
jgi:hypothetical protein